MGKSEDENGKTTFGAPLKAPKRSYVYMLKSSDKGATWSEPVNITGAVYNFEDGAFFAVAPGAGLAVDNRIIMPIYTLKGTVCIYSDDNGATWQRNPQFQYTDNVDEWCAVKAADNKIYAFGRAKNMPQHLLPFQRITVSAGTEQRMQNLRLLNVKRAQLQLVTKFMLLTRRAKREKTA